MTYIAYGFTFAWGVIVAMLIMLVIAGELK